MVATTARIERCYQYQPPTVPARTNGYLPPGITNAADAHTFHGRPAHHT